jgi:CDGSH-type Zn-finger protein
MAENNIENQESETDPMKITIRKNGPYIVTGNVPLIEQEICNDEEGHCRTYREVKRYPGQEQYALCRCGKSKNKPFCDGTHTQISFEGRETAGDESYLRFPSRVKGPALELEDYEELCVHARFCHRAGGIWSLTKQSDKPDAKNTAIEQSWNCPAGRLILKDRKTGEPIEPDLEKSIVVIEYPAKNEHGPLWVRGGIPVISANGKTYTIRNRLTLCRCGKSRNAPFCDGSHVDE